MATKTPPRHAAVMGCKISIGAMAEDARLVAARWVLPAIGDIGRRANKRATEKIAVDDSRARSTRPCPEERLLFERVAAGCKSAAGNEGKDPVSGSHIGWLSFFDAVFGSNLTKPRDESKSRFAKCEICANPCLLSVFPPMPRRKKMDGRPGTWPIRPKGEGVWFRTSAPAHASGNGAAGTSVAQPLHDAKRSIGTPAKSAGSRST